MTVARLALGAVVLASVSGVALRGYGGALGCPDPLCLAQSPGTVVAWMALGHRLLSVVAAVAVVAAAVRGRARALPAFGALGLLSAVAASGVWSHTSLLAPGATGLHLAASVGLAAALSALSVPGALRGRGAIVAGASVVAGLGTAFAVGSGALVACAQWPLCAADAGAASGLALFARMAWWSGTAVLLAMLAAPQFAPRDARSTAPSLRDGAQVVLRLFALCVAADIAMSWAPLPEFAVAQVLVLHLVVAAIPWLQSKYASTVVVRRPTPTSTPASAHGAGAPTPVRNP